MHSLVREDHCEPSVEGSDAADELHSKYLAGIAANAAAESEEKVAPAYPGETT